MVSPPPAMVSNAPALVSCAATLAIVIVPVWNGAISKAPTGPFETRVRAEARGLRPATWCAARCRESFDPPHGGISGMRQEETYASPPKS